MAAASEVLREYLLSLGFKVNTTQEKKWTATMGSVTKGAKGAALAVTGFATAAVAAFEVYANGMEKLYYMSQRSKIPIKALQALDYAGEQVGISAGTMNAALVKFANFMRNNPVMNQQLKILGVDPNQTPDKQFLGLLKALKGIDNIYARNARASLFDIDPETLNVFLTAGPDKLAALMEEQERHMDAMKIDSEAVGKSMVEWQNNLRTVGQEFKNLEGVIATSLIGPMRIVTQMTRDWLQDIEKAIVDSDKKSETWGAGGKAEAIARAATGNTNLPPPPPHTANTGSGFFNDQATGTLQNWRHWIVSQLYGEAEATRRLGFGRSAAGAGRGLINPPSGSITAGSGSSLPLGLRNHNPGNLRPGGASSGFQQFGSDEAGLLALARQLVTYGDRGKNTLRSIISTYAPSNENNTAAYIADLKARMGVGADQALDLNKVATLSSLMEGIVAHEQGMQPFAMSALDAAATTGISMGGFTQTVNVTVHGGDPAQVQTAVGSALDKSNGDLVRNIRTVFDTPRLAR